mmetsp:Transcript_456/g.599  ORF Transcript_456/g.599 Transcript_456/m.599 type:complete len:358 (-) Transcript_456:63-1136(-)
MSTQAPLENIQVLINEIPDGALQESTFKLAFTPISKQEILDGYVIIQVEYVSIDPTMKIWLDPKKTYLAPLKPGDVMRAAGVGTVIFSKSSKLSVGDSILGFELGWQKLAVVNERQVKKIHPLPGGLAKTAYLGILGHTGLAAYFGMLEVGKPQPGETVVVSGAAGATGSVAGQIAKIKGCRVVGIAGSSQKCEWLKELGFDDAINYKDPGFYKHLRKSCPKGVDVYFDNVGGPLLDFMMKIINHKARVVICGAVSDYNTTSTEKQYSLNNYLALVNKSAKMEGFLVFDFVKRYGEALKQLAIWIAQGKLKHQEHVVDGLENAPKALEMLFQGGNFGKLLVKVSKQYSSSKLMTSRL